MRRNTDLNVYLAGKITSNGWRKEIFNMRDVDWLFGDEPRSKYTFIHNRLHYRDNIYITGPFFLRCDHSCYHGDNSHGVGAGKICGCYGEDVFGHKEVYDICRCQIDKSDIVFAYINDNECYGTLFEIGYACRAGKRVMIIFDNEDRAKRYRDMWFIRQDEHVEYVNVIADEKQLRLEFDNVIKKEKNTYEEYHIDK